MQYWQDSDGVDFSNSPRCYGKEFQPKGTEKIDVAKISIRGRYPEKGWGYIEECHEMAVVIKGEGYIEVKDGEKQELSVGDVVYVEPEERFCWGGDMDLIVPCGPAFSPSKHHMEDE